MSIGNLLMKPEIPQNSQTSRRVVVVIPTYNEQENVSEIISAALAEQKPTNGFDLHVLIADSHSSDGTWKLVEDLAKANQKIHLLDVQERGIGVGLYKGFRYAIDELGADVLFEMDADFQHNPADIPRFLGIAAF